MAMKKTDEDIGMLDVLLVVAQNLKLLILGPIVVGLIVLGITYQLPPKFVSEAVLVLPVPAPTLIPPATPTLFPPVTPTQAATIMASPAVLDLVTNAQDIKKGESNHMSRSALAGQVNVTVVKDGLLRLEVTAATATEAQAFANAVIDAWLNTTLPTESERRELEKHLTYAENGLKAITTLLNTLTTEGGTRNNKSEIGASLIQVGELQTRYLADVTSASRAMQGLTRDVVKQAPTLPAAPQPVKKGLIAILAALGTGFTLLLFVYLRQAWRVAASDPTSAHKQSQLMKALGFRSQ